MRRWLPNLGNWATKIESWWALIGMISGTGVISLFGKQWELLAAQGWPVIFLFSLALSSLLLIALSLAYMAFVRLRQGAAPPHGHQVERKDIEIAHASNNDKMIYGVGAQADLMNFFCEFILPTILAQRALQHALISESKDQSMLRKYALQGITASPGAIDDFWQSFSRLWDAFGGSPLEYVPFEEMVDHISRIERNYSLFVEQAKDIACGIDYARDPRFKSYWEAWREKHTIMKERYDATIKKDPRFVTLFRPGRQSRWGDVY